MKIKMKIFYSVLGILFILSYLAFKNAENKKWQSIADFCDWMKENENGTVNVTWEVEGFPRNTTPTENCVKWNYDLSWLGIVTCEKRQEK